ncbi:MAG: hypothetical protein U9O96_07915 [Candidatus Thermoplasmatota archaeon]|nr:hypothetical protein [Candidatus Thermoplasmatota archaeon]
MLPPYPYSSVLNSYPAYSGDKILEIINEVSEEALYHYDKTIQDFGPHPTGSQECNAVAEFIYDEFQSYWPNVSYKEWKMKGLEGKNMVATLPGSTNFTVVISARMYRRAQMMMVLVYPVCSWLQKYSVSTHSNIR